jgi:OHCU decarboxylase
MTLADLNRAEQAEFVSAIGWIYEHSPWVAERAWRQRPFASLEALLAALQAEVAAAEEADQLALLRAHPDLGARARMSEASAGEQSGAGLDRLNRVDYERLQQLNAAYRAKFGFPFLFAVKGSAPAAILAALDRRLGSDERSELAEALRQVHRIAEFRARDTIAE